MPKPTVGCLQKRPDPIPVCPSPVGWGYFFFGTYQQRHFCAATASFNCRTRQVFTAWVVCCSLATMMAMSHPGLCTMASSHSLCHVLQIEHHDSHESSWFVHNGRVYDATAFLKDHPGGAESILIVAGQDATDEFNAIHSAKAKAMLSDYLIGKVAPAGSIAPASQAAAPQEVPFFPSSLLFIFLFVCPHMKSKISLDSSQMTPKTSQEDMGMDCTDDQVCTVMPVACCSLQALSGDPVRQLAAGLPHRAGGLILVLEILSRMLHFFQQILLHLLGNRFEYI